MKFYKLTYIILSLIFFTNANLYSQTNDEINPDGYNKFYYKNGKVSSKGFMRNGKPDGYWKTYYSTGILKSEGNRKLFKLDSLWIFYDKDGDTLKKINYYNGKKNGYYYTYQYKIKNGKKTGGLISKELYVNDIKQGQSYYYKNGKLDKIITYKDGQKDGIAYQYKDTLITSIYKYNKDYLVFKDKINRTDKTGKKQGVWKEFYKTGKIKLQKTYVNNKLNGLVIEYDKQGKPVKTAEYRGDSLISDSVDIKFDIKEQQEFYENGNIKFIGSFLDSIPVGLHKFYSADGSVIKARYYTKSGILKSSGTVDTLSRKQGSWLLYYPTGEIKAKGKYVRNMRTGKWTFYYKNQKIEQTGFYKRGYPINEWRWYYPSGKIWRIENLNKGTEDGSFVEFAETGDTILKGEYIDGEKEGYWFYSVGDHIEKGNFQESLKNGLWKYYYKSGDKMFVGSFVQGQENGKFTYYFPKNKIYLKGYYDMGVKEKLWYKYDENGELLWTIKYHNDKIKKINGVRFKLPRKLKNSDFPQPNNNIAH